jgi:hypothetical protein
LHGCWSAAWPRRRPLSIRTTVRFASDGELELIALIDSRLTTLGMSAQYLHPLAPPFAAGGGITMLWPFAAEERLLDPVIGSYVHGTATLDVDTGVQATTGMSFPLVTVGRRTDGWDIIPPTELPTLSLAVEGDVIESVGLRGMLTLQPVVVDTTQLVDPIGRISNRLLVIPTISAVLVNRF